MGAVDFKVDETFIAQNYWWWISEVEGARGSTFRCGSGIKQQAISICS
jgi:hypothetical protein